MTEPSPLLALLTEGPAEATIIISLGSQPRAIRPTQRRAPQTASCVLVTGASRTSVSAETSSFVGLRPEPRAAPAGLCQAARSLTSVRSPPPPLPHPVQRRRRPRGPATDTAAHRKNPQDPPARSVERHRSRVDGWIPEHHGQSRIFSTMDRGRAASCRRAGVLQAKGVRGGEGGCSIPSWREEKTARKIHVYYHFSLFLNS